MRLALALVLLAAPAAAAAETGILRLTVYSGAEIFRPRADHNAVELIPLGGGKPIAFDWRKQQFRAPYGRYDLLVVAGGFEVYRREVLIHQPEADVLVGLQLGQIAHIDGEVHTRLQGRVIAQELDYSQVWVRALPLFGTKTQTIDMRPDRTGRFASELPAPAPDVSEFLLIVSSTAPPQGSRTTYRCWRSSE